MPVTDLSPVEVGKLREKLQPEIAMYTASVDEATINEAMAELANIRK